MWCPGGGGGDGERGEERQEGEGRPPKPAPSALPAQKRAHHNGKVKARKMIGMMGKGDDGGKGRGKARRERGRGGGAVLLAPIRTARVGGGEGIQQGG